MMSDLTRRLCRSLAFHVVEVELTLSFMSGPGEQIAEIRDETAAARALIYEAGFDIDELYPVCERPIGEEADGGRH